MAGTTRGTPHDGAGEPRPDDLVDVLVQTSFATMAVLQRAAADHQLSLTQLRVLAILRDRRLRMSTLATYLGLERSTLSGLVDRALARGLLVREADADDGRAVAVTVTPAGAELADRVRDAVGRALDPTTRRLTATERDRLHRLLASMLAGPPTPATDVSAT